MSDLTVIDTPQPPAPPSGSGGARSIILAVAVLTALSVLLGGGIGLLMSSSIERNIARKEKDAEATHRSPSPKHYTGNIALVKLAPITTNLMSPQSMFIRIEASLIFPEDVAADTSLVKVLSAEISQDMMAFLNTVTLAQIQGPAGLQNLREDLADRVGIRAGDKVREFILETVVVQ